MSRKDDCCIGAESGIVEKEKAPFGVEKSGEAYDGIILPSAKAVGAVPRVWIDEAMTGRLSSAVV